MYRLDSSTLTAVVRGRVLTLPGELSYRAARVLPAALLTDSVRGPSVV